MAAFLSSESLHAVFGFVGVQEHDCASALLNYDRQPSLVNVCERCPLTDRVGSPPGSSRNMSCYPSSQWKCAADRTAVQSVKNGILPPIAESGIVTSTAAFANGSMSGRMLWQCAMRHNWTGRTD